jgi:hypothetical protein
VEHLSAMSYLTLLIMGFVNSDMVGFFLLETKTQQELIISLGPCDAPRLLELSPDFLSTWRQVYLILLLRAFGGGDETGVG